MACGRFLVYQKPVKDDEEDVEKIIPLKDVNVDVNIQGGLATMNVQLTYNNVCTENPVEVIFEAPLEKAQVIAKLEATIGDKHVKAKV